MGVDFDRVMEMAEPTFDRTPTVPIVIFELCVLVGVVALFVVFARHVRKLWLKFVVMAAGVLIFEIFTAPMWHNHRMGAWAYVYYDVSWILTAGWSALILAVILLADRWRPQWREPKQFCAYLAVLLPVVVVLETIVVKLGIRSYSPEVLQRAHMVRHLDIPCEVLYYVPVFLALVIAFYKYWNFLIDETPLVPVRRQKWLRGLGLAILAVLLFELMVEPMVENHKFPAWSYVWHDISIVMTGTWVLVIAVAALLVERFLFRQPLGIRFLAALAVMYALAVPIESWLIRQGYRVYGESAVQNFVGLTTPLTGVAVEIAFAIPCYLVLIVCFVRYWEISLDNRL